jgi:hypothetical protein
MVHHFWAKIVMMALWEPPLPFPADPAALGELYRQLSPKDRATFHHILDAEDPQKAQRRFLAFGQAVWPRFIHGSHDDPIAGNFERIERGELKRAIVNLPPRCTKSKFSSVMFPPGTSAVTPTAKSSRPRIPFL